jgi:hypothetical protein
MLNRRVLTSVVVALAATITTQSFAQHRGTVTPTAGAKAGATQGTFTTSDAIPWKPLDPKQPGLQMFVVWGNPNEGTSEIVQKFPAGWDSGWHWHTAAYEGVVVQDKWTHTGFFDSIPIASVSVASGSSGPTAVSRSRLTTAASTAG